MVSEQSFRTAAWYGDEILKMDFPHEWDIRCLWPRTPSPLTEEEIVDTLEHPTGQPPISEICRGKSRPLVIVDDLNRPTPAARVMRPLLRILRDGGTSARQVKILMATGAHGVPRKNAMTKKVGPEAASSCRTIVHDCTRDLVEVGRTSFGTPVIVNRAVALSDFVIGIGGIYPNQTAGFGGGSKLALGVLGERSIMHLHFRHESVGWGSSAKSNFRRDLDEIARLIGLNTMVSVHLNSDREIVRMRCGDPSCYFEDEIAFSKKTYLAPMPENTDVVVSNAYPNDLSLTFVLMKGITPLLHCRPEVTTIAVGSCSEGMGYHRLFPVTSSPMLHQLSARARRLSTMTPRELLDRTCSRFLRSFSLDGLRRGKPFLRRERPSEKNPIWLYRTQKSDEPLPSEVRRARVKSLWSEVLQVVKREQGDTKHLRILVYPCAPLQHLLPDTGSERQSS